MDGERIADLYIFNEFLQDQLHKLTCLPRGHWDREDMQIDLASEHHGQHELGAKQSITCNPGVTSSILIV
jgi:hypothetical protein